MEAEQVDINKALGLGDEQVQNEPEAKEEENQRERRQTHRIEEGASPASVALWEHQTHT